MDTSDQQVASDSLIFRSGRISLDLVATLGSRGILDIERLQDEATLAGWLRRAGLIGPGTSVRPSELQGAIELREAIFHGVSAKDLPFPGTAVRLLNSWAARPSLAPQIHSSGTPGWQEPRTVECALSTIARDAIELLAGPLRSKIKQCDGPGCTCFFVDSSRNGRRRWCSMEGCGNAVKGAAFVARRREMRQRESREGSLPSPQTD